jgi:hypothetical protein
MKDFWRKRFLLYEGLVVLLLAGGFLGWLTLRAGSVEALNSVLHDNRGSVYGALASIFGSLLGFAITALSLAITFSQDAKMELVRRSEHYGTMWDVFTKSITALSFATLAALLGLVVDREHSPSSWITALVVWASLLSIARLWRCVWILERVVDVIRRKGKEPAARVSTDTAGTGLK